ncbi:hypothetical protein [Vulgatibacter sp.]|uniref:hypothetical protein n=1 Tax=Vulgatibacter sp. TaxID=1971226 RepID=UPI003561ACD7
MKRMIGVVLGLSIAAVAAAASGCGGQSCNAMLPYCALDVALVHQSWEPGAYTFRFSLDGEHVRCTADLPLAEGETLACDSDKVTSPGWGPHHRAAGEWHAVLSITGSPSEVHILVEREGVEIGSTSIHPHYETTEPNGEGCGTCKNDDAIFAF